MQKETLWQADKGDGNFINPILFADYSDPDVIHVGETFYMTASSFNYTPGGLPILTSKDLIHWKLVNYAVENIDYEQYNKPAHSKGIWAPAIRYHDDIFYIYYACQMKVYLWYKLMTPPLGGHGAIRFLSLRAKAISTHALFGIQMAERILFMDMLKVELVSKVS